MKGEQVMSLIELDALVRLKKSVTVPSYVGFVRPRPAAFVINMAGAVILRMLRQGMFIHEKEPKSCT